MTHINDIRNALNAALARLHDLELLLEHRAANAYEWDANAITTACAEQWGIAKNVLYAPARGRPLVYARQAAMFLMAKHTTMQPREIASHFRPDMHIGTVAYAIKAVSSMMEMDPLFAGKVVRAETAYLIAKQNQK